MTEYPEMHTLEGLYLEDSYVLGIDIGLAKTEIHMEFVLTKSHAVYSRPKKGEKYCYRAGKLVFEGYSDVRLSGIVSRPNVGATGEEDFGNIDSMRKVDGSFEVFGEWGELTLIGGTVLAKLA